jgi:hypothetical protein
MRALLYVIVLVFIVLHTDLWFWSSSRLIGGLPVGLTYHIAYCFAASFLFWLLVRVHRKEKTEDAS